MATHNIAPRLRRMAVPVDDLVLSDRNPRRGDVGRIRESLRTNGQYQPIIAREGTGEVLAGNHRLIAAREEGWEKIAVLYVDVSDAEADRIRLADNRTSDSASYDDPLLAEILSTLAETDAGLIGTGFDDDDLDDLLASLEETEGEEVEHSGMEQHPNLEEYADAYRTKFVRSIIVDYAGPDYLWMVDRFADLRHQRSADSNSDALHSLFVELFPDTPPPSRPAEED